MLVVQATRRNLTIATRDDKIPRAALTPTLKISVGQLMSA